MTWTRLLGSCRCSGTESNPRAVAASLPAMFGGVTKLKILPSGSLNQAVFTGPATWTSPWRVTAPIEHYFDRAEGDDQHRGCFDEQACHTRNLDEEFLHSCQHACSVDDAPEADVRGGRVNRLWEASGWPITPAVIRCAESVRPYSKPIFQRRVALMGHSF